MFDLRDQPLLMLMIAKARCYFVEYQEQLKPSHLAARVFRVAAHLGGCTLMG